MKKIRIPIIIVSISLAISLISINGKGQAPSSEERRYEIAFCMEYHPDGSTHIGAKCTDPNPNGRCDERLKCNAGIEDPTIE